MLARLLPMLAALACFVAPPTRAADTVIEAETMTWTPASHSRSYSDSGASAGNALLMSGNATANATLNLPSTSRVTIRVRGDQCLGAPHGVLKIDGQVVLSGDVTSTAWAEVSTPVTLGSGAHMITVQYTNDLYWWGCDRNLRVDKLTLTTVTAPPTDQPDFVGNFETGDFTQWPVCQSVVVGSIDCLDYATNHYGMQVQSTTKRQGNYAARFEVRDGDIPGFCCGERAEVNGADATLTLEGDERWYQWSTRFEPGFPADRTWSVISQWHAEPNDSGSPPVAINASGDSLKDSHFGLVMRKYASPAQLEALYLPWQTPRDPGTWHDLKLHIRWSVRDDVGYVELWHNGVRQTFTGAPCAGLTRCAMRTLMPGGGGVYFKQGYYRDENMTQTGVVYHDGLSIALSEAGLKPL